MIRMISSEAGIDEVTQHLESLILQSRIQAEIKVLVAENISETMRTESQDAALVIIGFDTPEENEEVPFYHRMEKIIADLPRVVMVKSLGDAALDS